MFNFTQVSGRFSYQRQHTQIAAPMITRGDWGDFGHGRLRTLHPAQWRSIKS